MVTPSWAWTTSLCWIFSGTVLGCVCGEGVCVWVHLETLGSWSGSLLHCVRSSRRTGTRVGLRSTPVPRVLPGPQDARFHLTPNQYANLNWSSGP